MRNRIVRTLAVASLVLGALVGVQSGDVSASSLTGEIPLIGKESGDFTGKIVGGFPTTISDAPWQVMLVDYNEDFWGPLYLDAGFDAPIAYFPFCGGSILSATIVVTAAHCVDSGEGYSGPLSQVLRVGRGVTHAFGAELTGLPGSSFTKVKSISVHPDWNSVTSENDIAILRLTAPLKLNDSTIAAIKLPLEFDADSWPSAGTESLITGWGALSFEGTTPNQLQAAFVDVLSDPTSDSCGEYGVAFQNSTMLCAGDLAGGVDTCQGDSGGPLAIESDSSWYLAGITSFGNGCAEPDFPGVYTRVTSYLDWIVDQAFVQLDVSLTGNGLGSVTSNVGGIECGTSCSTVLDPKTKVTLTANADPGSRFVGWSGACRGKARTCKLNPSSAATAQANFELVELTVNFAGDGSGSVVSSPAGVTCVSSCAATFDEKARVTLTASPDLGSVFSGWSGSCRGNKPTCKVTLTAAKSVTATFTSTS